MVVIDRWMSPMSLSVVIFLPRCRHCVRRPRAIMGDAAEVPKEEEAKPVRAAAPRAQPAPRASTGTPRRQQRTLPSVAQTKTNAAATLLARPCLC